MNLGYALLIGVNDYSAYGAGYNLLGSLNDVSLWWKMCQDLGYAPENVRVLTSPALTSVDLHGAYTAAATHDEILEGVKWLAEKLGKDKGAVGLLTYSGHGDQTAEGLVICPTDTVAEGGGLGNVVHLLEMQKIFHHAGAAHGLTAVLDCCHSRSTGVGNRAALSLRKHGDRALPITEIPAIGERIFYAAKPGTAAYQGEFIGDRWQGAFTWAFMTVREQWRIAEQDGHNVLTISCADMERRVQALLDALTFDQAPELSTPPGKGEAEWPVFASGPGRTDPNPNGGRMPCQIDPNQYTLNVTTSPIVPPQNLGMILAIGSSTIQINGARAQKNMEYWFASATVLAQVVSNPTATWSLQVMQSKLHPSYTTPPGDTAYAPIAEYPSWTASLPLLQPSGGNASLLFSGTTIYNSPTAPVTLPTWVQLLVSGGTVQAVAWYIEWNQNPNDITNFAIDPGSTAAPGNIFALTSSGPSGTYWGTAANMTVSGG